MEPNLKDAAYSEKRDSCLVFLAVCCNVEGGGVGSAEGRQSSHLSMAPREDYGNGSFARSASILLPLFKHKIIEGVSSEIFFISTPGVLGGDIVYGETVPSRANQ